MNGGADMVTKGATNGVNGYWWLWTLLWTCLVTTWISKEIMFADHERPLRSRILTGKWKPQASRRVVEGTKTPVDEVRCYRPSPNQQRPRQEGPPGVQEALSLPLWNIKRRRTNGRSWNHTASARRINCATICSEWPLLGTKPSTSFATSRFWRQWIKPAHHCRKDRSYSRHGIGCPRPFAPVTRRVLLLKKNAACEGQARRENNRWRFSWMKGLSQNGYGF